MYFFKKLFLLCAFVLSSICVLNAQTVTEKPYTGFGELPVPIYFDYGYIRMPGLDRSVHVYVWSLYIDTDGKEKGIGGITTTRDDSGILYITELKPIIYPETTYEIRIYDRNFTWERIYLLNWDSK
ncbi:MAG: hypothetical protein LUH15_18250 [Tannerellaceae bacterium]|nr:hypothetical protein [Tannerellaceae bacterium]